MCCSEIIKPEFFSCNNLIGSNNLLESSCIPQHNFENRYNLIRSKFLENKTELTEWCANFHQLKPCSFLYFHTKAYIQKK